MQHALPHAKSCCFSDACASVNKPTQSVASVRPQDCSVNLLLEYLTYCNKVKGDKRVRTNHFCQYEPRQASCKTWTIKYSIVCAFSCVRKNKLCCFKPQVNQAVEFMSADQLS